MNIPTLKSDRFVLRAFREGDVPALTALHSDAEVMRYLRPNGTVETSPRQAWDYIALHMGHWLLKGYGKWALADRATDELIGRIGFFHAPYDWPGLELGWTVARRLWGQGYATEAASLALNWGFETLGQRDIISAIILGNEPSVRVAERLGARLLRQDVLHEAPALIYGYARDAWRTNNRA